MYAAKISRESNKIPYIIHNRNKFSETNGVRVVLIH